MNTNATRILLLEDDDNLGVIIKEHLTLNGFAVELRKNGGDGLTAYAENDFDLCLVDIMMPQMDGFTFTRTIRERDTRIPIIFLTAKSLQEDKIKGFKIGCDDYITKPFSIEELLLRIRAVLKRSGTDTVEPEQHLFAIGHFAFDSNKRILESPERVYKLTSKETELLKMLCQHINRTLSRADALREIWGTEDYFNSRSMDVFISKLRRYLKSDRRIEIINIHGKGFKLVIDA
ncbi:MAG: response regulator transcription factor [candidate division Zixibacteria bacterium]|nr:response regulator transcription factor [candidate division Zixibacteria bacterium]